MFFLGIQFPDNQKDRNLDYFISKLSKNRENSTKFRQLKKRHKYS